MKRFLAACWLLGAGALQADERILNYHSEILVKSDGWIEVAETIVVRAEGRQIRRGIFRDYPTGYQDKNGNDVQVLYEPRSVLRNDRREDFHSENLRNGVRTYFGSSDRMLQPGIHTYTYRYDAGRMLGFFEDHDELYWNVTGDGWEFPIDSATATVSFDFAITGDAIGVAAYTGAYGGSGDAVIASTQYSGQANFETTAPLPPRHGLTIAVTWPKGFVVEPGTMQKTLWLLSDNLNLLIALAGLLAMFAYYVPVWQAYGRDPDAGVIFARYAPPDGFSPASLRYIERMSYDDKAMTAAVVSLAVKGFLRINEDDDGHSLMRTDPGENPAALATGERELHDALFSKGDLVVLDNKNHELLGNARAAHRTSLQRDYANRYFRTNAVLNLPPLLVGILAAVLALNVASGPTVFVIAIIVAMVVTLVVFAILMKRPTGLGRKLLDEVSGFREFLEIAEKDEMNLRNPPQKTPLLFERYLPFALAMGVEQQWAERFASVFARLQEPGTAAYHPSWYSGNWNTFDVGTKTAGLSSGLGSAISSSVTPPGSSSGGGGGGFSGGGGGGGGGGGW
jgi:uncharacterized membrane protein YgcG